MAVFSALKNKKNQKMREGIEDLAIKCSEPINEKEEPQIQIDLLVKQFDSFNIKLNEKELSKLEKLSNDDGSISKEEFVNYAKSCGTVKEYLEKVTREHNKASRPVTSVNVDKASAAFKAIDKDHSGYVDRDEFLQFTSNLPPKQQEKLLKKIDKDGDGKITLDEFRQLFEKQK